MTTERLGATYKAPVPTTPTAESPARGSSDAGDPASASQQAFVGYEYLTVEAPAELEPLYRDVYNAFGWTLDEEARRSEVIPVTPRNHPGAKVAFKAKRDRRIRNRQLLNELQRRANRHLGSIGQLERSKRNHATWTALTLGIVGSVFLAGSIFALNASLVVLTVILGAVGLLLWLGGFIGYNRAKSRRTAKVDPLIDQEHEALYSTLAEADRLLN